MHRAARVSQGMTLVELMVGMAVGLFVCVVAVSVFVSTRTLQSVSSAGTRMGENGRLAMDLLTGDLRSAGFQGCKPLLSGAVISTLNPSGGAFLDGGSSGLGGFAATASGFAPPLSAALAGLVPAPASNSDVLSVRVPVDSASVDLTAPMASTTAALQVGDAAATPKFKPGDIALVANCRAAVLFQVTDASPGVLGHAAGGSFAPGNAGTDLTQKFRSDASVFRLRTHHYYVAPSVQRPGTNSLWRFAFPAEPGSASPAEVAAGVDRLVLSFGVDTDGDQNVNKYVAADAVGAWDQVVAARVQLLTATTQDGMAQHAQTVAFAGSGVDAADRRLRMALTDVVTLRNRAP